MRIQTGSDFRKGQVAKKQILGFKPAAGLEQADDEYCEHVQDRKHRYQRCNDSALLRESGPDVIFGRDKWPPILYAVKWL